MAHPLNSRASLDGLPPELRLRIYSHLTDLQQNDSKATNLPVLLHVNRKIYHEALPVLYAVLEHKVKRFEVPSHTIPHLRNVFVQMDARLFSCTASKLSALISYLIRWCAKLERVRIYIDTTSSEIGWSVSKPDIDKLRFDVPAAVARASTLREIVVETRERRLRDEMRFPSETDWLCGKVVWGLEKAVREVELPVEVCARRIIVPMRRVLLQEENNDGANEEGDSESEPEDATPYRSEHWGGRELRFFDVLGAED